MTYPIVLANGPPTADLKTVAEAGVTMIRAGRADWNEPSIEAQLAAERTTLDAAHAAGLRCWLWLGTLTNLPPGAPSPQERLLTRVVETLYPVSYPPGVHTDQKN